jgi:hypothetical protein
MVFLLSKHDFVATHALDKTLPAEAGKEQTEGPFGKGRR